MKMDKEAKKLGKPKKKTKIQRLDTGGQWVCYTSDWKVVEKYHEDDARVIKTGFDENIRIFEDKKVGLFIYREIEVEQ